MSKVNSITWFRDKSEAKKETITKNVNLNLPDLQFFLMCQKHYRVNRGVFNTIDAWFYEYGIVSIIHRRTSVLAFLDFVKEADQDSDQQKFIRFGHGGLTSRLQQFMEDSSGEREIV